MNRGSFGMVQTSVPFGEVSAVCDWMGRQAPVGKPAQEHSKRRVEGLASRCSEAEWAIGIGGFAEQRLRRLLAGDRPSPALKQRMQVAQTLHPSPANPIANRGWAEAVERTLAPLGLLSEADVKRSGFSRCRNP